MICINDFQKYKKGEWKVHIFEECTSTFDIAKQFIKTGVENGTMIISDVQTGGRGRQSRKWISPSGGIWMCIVLKPELELSRLSPITLLCAVAVAQSMDNLYPQLVAGIKWPNDVYINDRKICGILTETVLEKNKAKYVIVGIGINANNTTDYFDDDIRNTSVSLKELGIDVNRPLLAAMINDKLLNLIKRYENENGLDFILNYYKSRMLWLNEKAVMKNTTNNQIVKKGIIRGIDGQGQLLMETDGEIVPVISGELSLRRFS